MKQIYLKEVYRRAIIKFAVFYLLVGILIYLFREFAPTFFPMFGRGLDKIKTLFGF